MTAWKNKLHGTCKAGTFKPVRGRNNPTVFLPLSTILGRQSTPSNKHKCKDSKYLIEEQVRHIYTR